MSAVVACIRCIDRLHSVVRRSRARSETGTLGVAGRPALHTPSMPDTRCLKQSALGGALGFSIGGAAGTTPTSPPPPLRLRAAVCWRRRYHGNNGGGGAARGTIQPEGRVHRQPDRQGASRSPLRPSEQHARAYFLAPMPDTQTAVAATVVLSGLTAWLTGGPFTDGGRVWFLPGRREWLLVPLGEGGTVILDCR
jgi:hypothetical protein